MKIRLSHEFKDIVSLENFLSAWKEFIKGKRQKLDVQVFSSTLFDNILQLRYDLVNFKYTHGSYNRFTISDPKPRVIHKATVRDRVAHHAIYKVLYPFFERVFIADSFSCQLKKGTHRAINRFRAFAYEVSKNHTKTCWVLKCDIKKFFDSVDHEVLLDILKSYIEDKNIIWLLQEVTKSFSTALNKGLPLGNLTSQLFANIYMNEFDQFVKHTLRIKYYIRYADDFAVLSCNKEVLNEYVSIFQKFLREKLKLSLHPNKIFIKTFASGIDFLGWVHFSDHRVLRRSTRKRMIKNLRENNRIETLQSYLGLINHGNTFKLHNKIEGY